MSKPQNVSAAIADMVQHLGGLAPAPPSRRLMPARWTMLRCLAPANRLYQSVCASPRATLKGARLRGEAAIGECHTCAPLDRAPGLSDAECFQHCAEAALVANELGGYYIDFEPVERRRAGSRQ